MSGIELNQANASVFVPDGSDPNSALARTTHLGVGAHQDDLEILAAEGILSCFASPERWFCGVVVTDGGSSARDFEYANFSDHEMKRVRLKEQQKAAFVGEYGAQVFLDYPSKLAKDASQSVLIEDLVSVLRATQPETVYTHNLADKHDTHVAVVLRVLAACRRLPEAERPRRVIGCEVWRDLDWLLDGEKVVMSLPGRENLQAALLGVLDSQIAGGKRYDLATAGRRRAHATFFESHDTDQSQAMVWGMDLTALVRDEALDPISHVEEAIERFRSDVRARIAKLR